MKFLAITTTVASVLLVILSLTLNSQLNDYKKLAKIDNDKIAINQERVNLCGDMLGAASELNLSKLDELTAKAQPVADKSEQIYQERQTQLKKMGINFQ